MPWCSRVKLAPKSQCQEATTKQRVNHWTKRRVKKHLCILDILKSMGPSEMGLRVPSWLTALQSHAVSSLKGHGDQGKSWMTGKVQIYTHVPKRRSGKLQAHQLQVSPWTHSEMSPQGSCCYDHERQRGHLEEPTWIYQWWMLDQLIAVWVNWKNLLSGRMVVVIWLHFINTFDSLP